MIKLLDCNRKNKTVFTNIFFGRKIVFENTFFVHIRFD